MPNPFVTSSMVWDGDINPEGLAEQYKYTLQLGGGLPATDAVAATDKDGETMVTETTVPAFVPTLALFANFGQFVYDDSNSENPVGPSPSGIPDTDAYLLGWQISAKYTFRKDMSVQIAPTLYNYTGNGDTFNRQFSGDPTFAVVDPVSGLVTTTTPNQTGINSLLVLEVPAEFAFKIGKLPAKVFGDFAYNCEGGERARRRVTPRKGIKAWPTRSEPASAAPSTRETSA
jgi:hypothetical protein